MMKTLVMTPAVEGDVITNSPLDPRLDGIGDVFKLLRRPMDSRSVIEWAKNNIMVGGWSPWPGPFDPSVTPWIIEPLNNLGRIGHKRMTIVGPAAGGKSTIGEVYLNWLITNAPGFTVWYAHTDEAAKQFSETRITRMMDSCRATAAMYPDNRHAKRVQAVHFPHMSLLVEAANETNAQSKHIRHLIMDETWQYKAGMVKQLMNRTVRYAHNATILELSTGSIQGDETDAAWKQGTRQEWQFFCEACGTHHVPRWSPDKETGRGGVHWSKAAKGENGEWDFKAVQESVFYQCPNCGHEYRPNAANKYSLNKYGKYTEPVSGAVLRHYSYHWTAIASDFEQLGVLAVNYLDSKAAIKRGAMEPYKDFVQKKLAGAWSDEPPEEVFVYTPSGYMLGDVWPEEYMRFMTVDVQKDHFWFVIRAWSKLGYSRLIRTGRLNSWEEVAAVQKENRVEANKVLLDSGYSANDVYRQCAQHGWFCVKGVAGVGGFRIEDPETGQVTQSMWTRSPSPDVWIGTGRAAGQTCVLLSVSDAMSSDMLALFRSGTAEGWSVAADTPDFYRRQLAARIKRKTTNPATGASVWKWFTVGAQGEHLWDCERYQLAAACAAGLLSSQEQAIATTLPAEISREKIGT